MTQEKRETAVKDWQSSRKGSGRKPERFSKKYEFFIYEYGKLSKLKMAAIQQRLMWY